MIPPQLHVSSNNRSRRAFFNSTVTIHRSKRRLSTSVHKAYKDLLGFDSKFASDRASKLIGKIIAGEDNISRDTLTNSKTMLLQSESFNLDDNKTSTYEKWRADSEL